MNRPVNAHPVLMPSYIEPVEPSTSQSTVLRPRGKVSEVPVIQAALAGYVTDMSISEPSFRATGALRHAPASRILTLTHTLIFYELPDWPSWLQFDAERESLSHGRALGTGRIFAPDGRYLVSASQVGFVKFGSLSSD